MAGGVDSKRKNGRNAIIFWLGKKRGGHFEIPEKLLYVDRQTQGGKKGRGDPASG